MATVLVVDDDAGIRESAAMALEKVGLKTLQAGDVTSALQLLRAHRVDVVLSDIYMPGETGLTLLQAIAERRDPPRVILMTARGTIETTALAQRIGAFDYLAKPFDLGDLIDRVRAALADRVPEEVEIEAGPASRIMGSDARIGARLRSGSSRARMPIAKGSSPNGSFARICNTGLRFTRSLYRRFAIAPPTSRCSSTTSGAASPRR